MIAPLVALLLQTTPGDKPVHVWLDASSPLARGSAVRVYVQVATGGNLVVLQRRTDGRIAVLFPGSPASPARVRAGTYEIRGPSDRPALVVAEPDGQGMILAALATDPVRFNEFVREADWNPDALVPSWRGTDAEGALTDIVQRMLGDGTFNYDFVTYTVAPAPAVYAQQQESPGYAAPSTCVDCTFIGTEVVVTAPFLDCDAFFGVCFGFRHVPREPARPQPAADAPPRFLALTLRPRGGPATVARSRETLIPKGDRSTPVIRPRPRLPDAPVSEGLALRGEPVVLEHLPAGAGVATIAPRRRDASSAAPPAPAAAVTAPLRHVRYTRLSSPSPGSDEMARGGVVVVAHGAVVPARAAAGVASGPVASRARTGAWGMAVAGGAALAPRTNVGPAQSGATTAGTRAVALPSARSRATGGRAGVARAGVARH